jgi:hypothetical protein
VTQPVIYVATFKINEGKFQEYQRFYAENLKVVEENNPRLIALHTFANDDGTEITNINVATIGEHRCPYGHPRRRGCQLATVRQGGCSGSSERRSPDRTGA